MQGAVAFWREPLDDRYSIPRPLLRGRSIRTQTILFCLLPTVLLAVTYFLLVEFVLRESTGDELRVGLLRWGGAGLAALAVAIALGLGWLLADGVRRPLRTLLRVADGGNGGTGGLDPASLLTAGDPELRRLILRVHTLTQQNRAGAEALREHRLLQSDLALLRERVAAASSEEPSPSRLPEPGSADGHRLAEAIDRLVAGLRDRIESVEKRLRDLDERMAAAPPDSGLVRSRVGEALRELERIGTVWSLELEMARRHAPGMPGELGAKIHLFQNAMEAVRRAVEKNGEQPDRFKEARSDLAILREELHDWFRRKAGSSRNDSSRIDGGMPG